MEPHEQRTTHPLLIGRPFQRFVVRSKDRKTILLEGSGHIGLAIASRAQKEVGPRPPNGWLREPIRPDSRGQNAPLESMAFYVRRRELIP